MTIEEIERFVEDAGSDDVPTFGGIHEGGIHCQQVPDEIAPCIKAILETGHGIRAYLEIGSAAGGTAFLFHHFFHPGRMVLIDDNKHHKAGLRPLVLAEVPHRNIAGRSDEESVVKAARSLAPYDAVLIDGDHLYTGAKIDTVLYLPMVAQGGFFILHDSALPAWGVTRVVRELKQDPDLEFIGEYVSTKHPRPCGVALFRRKL